MFERIIRACRLYRKQIHQSLLLLSIVTVALWTILSPALQFAFSKFFGTAFLAISPPAATLITLTLAIVAVVLINLIVYNFHDIFGLHAPRNQLKPHLIKEPTSTIDNQNDMHSDIIDNNENNTSYFEVLSPIMSGQSQDNNKEKFFKHTYNQRSMSLILPGTESLKLFESHNKYKDISNIKIGTSSFLDITSKYNQTQKHNLNEITSHHNQLNTLPLTNKLKRKDTFHINSVKTIATELNYSQVTPAPNKSFLRECSLTNSADLSKIEESSPNPNNNESSSKKNSHKPPVIQSGHDDSLDEKLISSYSYII